MGWVNKEVILNNSGSYVRGTLELKNSKRLYLHVGSAGIAVSKYPAYGGGGPGQYGGGGSTDIRLESGPYEDFEGLKSRIIVASGSGGRDDGLPGAGGCLNGFDSEHGYGLGASQTSGGQSGIKGGFGFGGGDGNRRTWDGSPDGNGGGGSGYFGGGSSSIPTLYSGGGGSSFISGHQGCIAIDRSSTKDSIIFSNNKDQSMHYSGLKFTDTEMIDGLSECPHPNYFEGNYSYDGNNHPNNGFIRITVISYYETDSYIKLDFNQCVYLSVAMSDCIE